MERISLYNVMTKEVLINLRVRSEVRDDFKIVAELRGSTVSGLLYQFMVKEIREEKERNSLPFEQPKLEPAEMIEVENLNSQKEQKRRKAS